MNFCIILICCFAFLQISALEIFEFEDALNDTQLEYIAWRSDASNNKTLRIVDTTAKNVIVQLTLCVRPHIEHDNVSISISDVRYSNDGVKDYVLFRLQGNYLAHFHTTQNWDKGFGWNTFRQTGTLGEKIYLKRGQYELSVVVLTDIHGVELDTVTIQTENQHPFLGLACKAAFTKT